jgi:hypothetical protein
LAGLLFAAMALALTQATAPQSPPPAPPVPAQPRSDDIVVTALRDIDDKGSAVTAQTLGSARTGDAVGSRTTFALAQRWAACAVAAGLGRREWLRKAIDSRTNSTWQAFAMQRLAQINMACAPDASRARDGAITDPYYDRGALVIAALAAYAPNLRLSKAQTADPAVQARFNAREIPLARFRLPVDRTYFETAICFVRLQPELSVRLATAETLDAQRRLEAAIVNRARVCVGNAKRVYFDGTQFRFYIADAVYRWAVAARGVDTLVPAG